MTQLIYEKIISDLDSVTIKGTDADGKIWWIPTDPTNSHYQAYLKWLEEQNG